MARAYDDDLRRKLFEAHAKGLGSFRELAGVFGVSLGYVEKIFRQRSRTGLMERVRYRPGPKSRVSEAVAARIVELVELHADITVAELRERVVADTGVAMSWSLVREWVVRLGLRLKKSRYTRSSATPKPTASGAGSSSMRSAPSRRRD